MGKRLNKKFHNIRYAIFTNILFLLSNIILRANLEDPNQNDDARLARATLPVSAGQRLQQSAYHDR